MAPLKFEDKIKEKLDKRVIQPSNSSWEKLATQLDEVQSPKKKSEIKKWYSVAAIFIGVLALTSIMIYQNIDKVEPEGVLVGNDNKGVEVKNEKPMGDQELEENRIKKSTPKLQDNIVATTEETLILKKVNKVNKEEIISSKSEEFKYREKKEDLIHSQSTEKIAENTINTTSKEEIPSISDAVIDEKVEGVIAQIEEFKNKDIQVSEEEINQLLLKAQQEIITDKILKSDKVSASALLEEVEGELDETFKQRVFEALKTGYQKVKTAVAERKN